jgi:hypothetical protein
MCFLYAVILSRTALESFAHRILGFLPPNEKIPSVLQKIEPNHFINLKESGKAHLRISMTIQRTDQLVVS